MEESCTTACTFAATVGRLSQVEWCALYDICRLDPRVLRVMSELTIYLIFHSWDMPSHTAMLWLISAYSYFLVNKSNIPLRILRLGLVTLLEIELSSDAYCYSH